MRRAIIQSGPLNLVPVEDQKKLTEAVLKEFAVPIGDADALAKVPLEKIATGVMQDKLSDGAEGEYGAMSATKLPTTGAVGTTFLPDDVLKAIELGRMSDIDIMIGSNRHDGRGSVMGIPLPNSWMRGYINDFTGGLIGPDEASRAALRERVKAAMPGASDDEIDEQIQTDAVYRMRGWQAAATHSRESSGKTYLYQFNWESPVAGGDLGAIHALELPFVFDNLARTPRAVGDLAAAQPLASKMSDAWVSFAKTGVPSASGLPAWPEYNEETRSMMQLDNTCKVVNDPDRALREAWAVK